VHTGRALIGFNAVFCLLLMA